MDKKKCIEWNPGLDNKVITNRSEGRPRNRLEDDINDFLRPEEPEAEGNDLKKHCTWKEHAR